ncbi:MAG: amidohydrolase family protein [Steroidobacter sp.]
MSTNEMLSALARSFLPIVFIATCVGGCKPAPDARRVDLLIVGGAAIDPGSGSIISDAVIAIDDGKIAAIQASDATTFVADETIDAAGKYVMPALTDMHLHWGNGTFVERDDLVETTLARSLYYGVTRVLNMGSNAASPAHIDAYRQKLRDGTWQGPRIYAVGSLVTVPGSHPTSTRRLARTRIEILSAHSCRQAHRRQAHSAAGSVGEPRPLDERSAMKAQRGIRKRQLLHRE